MELKNNYFHGVQPHIYYGDSSERKNKLRDILRKYDYIFKCGYILPYKDIKDIYGGIDRHPVAHYNGDDKVSISLHELRPEQVDREWMRKYHDREENAFRRFIFQDGYPSAIVLNESIKDKYELIPGVMYLERQIGEPISLDYMEAISIFPNSEIAPYFETGDDLKLHGRYYDESFNIEFLKRLRMMLKIYGYDVPIVSIVTGHEFDENKVYRK